MLDIQQFRDLVVQPVLQRLGNWNTAMNSQAAENLLVGTAIQESHVTYLKQLGGGPALSVMQIEPTTHDDVWTNYLADRDDLAQVILGFAAGNIHDAAQMPWNMGYSVAMARLVFWRQPDPMPTDANNLQALGQYWKDHYNTGAGAGTVEEWVENYQKYGDST